MSVCSSDDCASPLVTAWQTPRQDRRIPRRQGSDLACESTTSRSQPPPRVDLHLPPGTGLFQYYGWWYDQPNEQAPTSPSGSQSSPSSEQSAARSFYEEPYTAQRYVMPQEALHSHNAFEGQSQQAPRMSNDPESWTGLIVTAILNILHSICKWPVNLWNCMLKDSARTQHIHELQSATSWIDWWAAAKALDSEKKSLSWILNPIDKQYDWRHVRDRRKKLERLRHEGSFIQIGDVLRHSLMRHMYGITNLGLYKRTYAVTKEEIHLYIDETVAAIRAVTASSTALATRAGHFTAQDKRSLLHDLQKTYGKTALVLQGGSIFGICHLGVVRALDEQDILPNVIVGTATGALMAALVGSKTREELPDFVSGDSLDLSAFAERSRQAQKQTEGHKKLPRFLRPLGRLSNWLQVMMRRIRRITKAGFVLDPDVLARCVEDNVGDLTFEEAYKKTGRILNIVVSSPSEDVPNLMNYLTAPSYLIRSAAMASHASNVGNSQLEAMQLLYKDINGNIKEKEVSMPKRRQKRDRPRLSAERNTQFRRLRQQFNVDHYIISQARPYIVPFTRPSLPYIRGQRQMRVLIGHFVGIWIRTALDILDFLNLLPAGIHRVLSDETIGTDKNITLVADIAFKDWPQLLQNPKKDNLDTWLLKGERAVWPSLCALKVRMAVEVALKDCWDELCQRDMSTMHRTNHPGETVGDYPQRPRSSPSNQNRDNEDRLLRDMQRGVGGFVPGITGMDQISGSGQRPSSQQDFAYDFEGEGDQRERKIPRLVLNNGNAGQATGFSNANMLE